jgi:hypothetical protein
LVDCGHDNISQEQADVSVEVHDSGRHAEGEGMIRHTDVLELDRILVSLNDALGKIAIEAPPAYIAYAANLLNLTHDYAYTIRANTEGQDVQLVWRQDVNAVRRLSDGVLDLVQSGQWRRALKQSRVVLSVLPGWPGTIPIDPPEFPGEEEEQVKV